MSTAAIPGRTIVLCLITLLSLVLSGVLLYPSVQDAWDQRQSRLAHEALEREREVHRHVEFIVGFYVGPSYTAAVALFRNGTTLNLAKVDGDAAYRAAMQRRIGRANAVKAWYDQNWPLLDDGGRFGTATSKELQQVFIPALRTLKERSEAILQHRIEHVHFATPWVAEYHQPRRDDENDAFLLAMRKLGLKTALIYDDIQKTNIPTHLNEANAVLAAAGRKLCEGCFCTSWLYDQFSGQGSNILYINLGQKSIFISEQPGSCVFEAYWARNLYMDSAHGLEQLQVQDAKQYWAGVRSWVMFHFVAWYQRRTVAFMILLAGEATTDPRFLSMGRSIQQELLMLRSDNNNNNSFGFDSNFKYQHTESPDPLELVVAVDGVFDAARGAALMTRTDFWGYCDDVDEDAMRLACHNYYEQNGVRWSDWYSLELN